MKEDHTALLKITISSKLGIATADVDPEEVSVHGSLMIQL